MYPDFRDDPTMLDVYCQLGTKTDNSKCTNYNNGRNAGNYIATGRPVAADL